jgi:hypothetical protein
MVFGIDTTTRLREIVVCHRLFAVDDLEVRGVARLVLTHGIVDSMSIGIQIRLNFAIASEKLSPLRISASAFRSSAA